MSVATGPHSLARESFTTAWPIWIIALAVVTGGALEFSLGGDVYGINTIQVAVGVIAVGAVVTVSRARRVRLDFALLPYAVLLLIPVAQGLRDGISPMVAGGLGRFITVLVLLLALPQFRRDGRALNGWEVPVITLGAVIGLMVLIRIVPALADPTLGFYDLKDVIRLPLGNHNYVAVILALSLVVALGRGAGSRWRLAAVGVMGMGLAFTLSRGGWLAFAVAVLALAAVRRDRWTLVAVGAVAIGAVLLLGLMVFAGDAAARLRGLFSPATSARIELWQASLEAFRANPVLGVGVNRLPEWMANVRQPYVHAHSMVIETLATTGVVGTIAYLGYWATGIRRVFRLDGKLLRITLGLPLLVLFVHAQVDSLNYLLVYEVLVAMFIGIAATYDGTLPTVGLGRGREPAYVGQ